MSHDSMGKNTTVSMKRTLWRTIALLILFIILLINYRQLIQGQSLFSFIAAISSAKSDTSLSTGLLWDLVYFFVVLLVLHLIWAIIITLSCKPLFHLAANENIKTQYWLSVVLMHITLLLAANAYFYPTSLVGFLRATPFSEPYFLIGLSLLLMGLFLLGLYQLMTKMSFMLFCLSATVIVAGYLSSERTPHFIAINKQSPNVIIIGIDALRPDHLAYRGASNNLAPQLDHFLSQAIVYDKTYTPMGRTYVAWMSLLTGQYPKTHGARFNLAPPELVTKNMPLIRELNQRGYQTTYAMDERRFNHIDKTYGFNQIIGPQAGAADTIITNISDLPLINLLINTPISKTLFPYLYINRAYGKAYVPSHFNRDVLASLSMDRPNLLAVHFCMLHWPYTSKDFVTPDPVLWQGNYNHFLYQQLIKQVDNQFGQFINNLNQQGLLNDAIVFLISDHGDSFKLDKDLLQNERVEGKTSLAVSAWGHATNVIVQEQNEVVMAYSRFKKGKPVSEHVKIEGTFSLVDIMPTLFNELDLELSNDENFDGKILPLTNELVDRTRMVFVESSRPVNSINTSFIDEKKVLSETAATYEVRESGRAVMKPAIYFNLIEEKQRAVYFKAWQLAMLPNYDELVLVNTTNKQWHNLTNYQGDAPWQKMLSALCEHNRGDIGFDHLDKCNLVHQSIEN